MTNTGNDKTQILSESQVQTLMEHLKKHENRQNFTHPYFDSKGYLTAGPGFKIESAEELASLNPVITKDGKEVSAKDAFAILGQNAPKTPEEMNKKARAYKNGIGGLTIKFPPEAIDRKLREEITQRAAKARDALGKENWDKLPGGAKHAVVDAAYTTGGVEGWDGLKKAAENYDGSMESRKAFAKETLWVIDRQEMNRPAKRQIDNITGIIGDPDAAEVFYGELTADDEKKAAENRKKAEEEAAQPKPQGLPGEGGDDAINGGAGKDSPVAREKPAEESESPDDARIRGMMELVEGDRFDSAEDLLLLRPDQITRAQAHDLMRAYLDLPSGDPRRDEFAHQKTAFFDHVYGAGPQRKDYTGRPMDDGPKNPPPTEAQRPRDGRGADIADAVKQTAGMIAHYAKGTGLAPAVEALQSGLNLMERARLVRDKTEAEKARKSGGTFKPETPFRFKGVLKEDGAFGPKTRAQLKRTAARDGAHTAKNALALGGFRALARTADADAARGLVDAHMGGLFPARSQQPKRKPQVMALQSTLNAMRPAGTEELKEDGDFGPKTAAVFTATAKKRDADELSGRFARELGFI